MKAKELIIGDLVLYFGKVFSILKVDPETELSIIEDARHFEEANINDLSPIPLTPEILERNGWKTFIELHDFRYAFKIDDLCYLVVMTGFLDGIRIFIRKGTIYSKLRTLKYVSDLQHLLFGLGLNSEMEV